MRHALAYWRMAWWQRRNPFLHYAPPGHFYSPLPDMAEAAGRGRAPAGVPETLPGLALNDGAQLALLQIIQSVPPTWSRYTPANTMFVDADARALAGVLRHYHPRQYVEVGSGYSSAVALDTNDHFLGGRLSCTFIEPYPARLYALLTPDDRRHELLIMPVQEVPREVFTSLVAGDVLFIDSSHVAKIGSDVVYLLTDILPRLARGVLIHLHDIF